MASQGSVGGILVAAVFAGTLGWIVGSWQGSSRVEANYERWLMRADLPPVCERLLNEAGADINAEWEDRQRAGEFR